MARKLDRLNASNEKGLAFQRLWQRNCEVVEGNFTDISQVVSDLASAVADIATAQAAAAAAAADAAAVKKTDKISASTIVPASVLSATDAGSNATVAVAAHTRVYGDGAQLSVASHNFTGKAYSTKYAVYYDDPTCADTTPTYHITTTLSNAVANFASGRHFLGIVTTPASGGAATSGGATGPGVDPVDRGDMSSL